MQLEGPKAYSAGDTEPVDRLLAAAVGSAAGGLEATAELIHDLGDRPGMALLIASKVSAAHDTVAALERVTRMPVSMLATGARLRADQIYVVPASTEFRVTDGVVQLERIEHDSPASVDALFEAIADDFGARSVAVVLSGAGSDGTAGVGRVRMVGGFTFAQDATAKQSGMPNSAVACGCVDFVAAPAGIAKQLLLLAGHGEAAGASTGEPTPDAAAFRRLLAMMAAESGIDFDRYRPATLRRRVQRRMLLRRMTQLSAYAELVATEPDEARALVEDALIHVTSFFRDAAVFDALDACVFPELLARHRPGQPLRVWVPACSTGEEAYAIAMRLTEFLGRQGAGNVPIKVFGTDVSPSAIRRARAGCYACSIEQEVSPERLQVHFIKSGDGYQVRQNIRDACVFACHDVTRDPPYSRVDFVSCRNLLIYLERELQARVLGLFHYALRSDGFLVLGSSETASAAAGFTGVDLTHKIYRRLPVGPQQWFAFRPPRLPGSEPSRPGFARGLDVVYEADRIVLSRFAPPGVVVSDDLDIIQFRGSTAPYLAPAPGMSSFALLRMAREELRSPLRQTIEAARSRQASVRRGHVPLLGDLAACSVSIEVIPFTALSKHQRFFIVLFQEALASSEATRAPALAAHDEEGLISELRQEIAANRDYLSGIIDQLEASNEELTAAIEENTASNEELQTMNEELEQAKEELQATNNELRALNKQLEARNEEALRLGNDLENVLSSAAIPILLLGPDGRISRFAPAAESAFGLRAVDIGRPLSDLTHPLACAGVDMARQVLAEGRLAERVHQDAAGHWYQLTARPYVTSNGDVKGTVIAAVDIDAVKKASERLAEAQQYAESILETVLECLVVVDGERRVRSANRAFYETFGLQAPLAVGRRLAELGAGPWAAPTVERLLEAIASGETSREGRAELPGVDHEPCAYLVSAVRLPGGPNVRLSFIDITDRERARKALERSEAEFFDVLATAAVGILISDMTGRIAFANGELGRIFGYPPRELVGQSVDVLVPERFASGHARLRENYQSESLRRRMGNDRELVGRRKDGSDVAIEVTLSPLERNTGRLVVSFVTDVTLACETQRKVLLHQDKLQQMAFDAALATERERRRIASDLHDRIGQALSFAEMRLKTARASETGKDAAMDEAVALLARTSEDVRTLMFELSPPILYDLGLEAAVSWLADDLGRRTGINIEVESEEARTPLTDTAASVVFRGVRELLTNVVKHAQAPTAHVSIRRCEDRLVIKVRDGGIGFDVNERLLETDRARFGLFSVREQLQRLGGTLRVDSSEQRGTCVSLELPLGSSGNAVAGGAADAVARAPVEPQPNAER